MRIKEILNQNRRDFSATMECEFCEATELNIKDMEIVQKSNLQMGVLMFGLYKKDGYEFTAEEVRAVNNALANLRNESPVEIEPEKPDCETPASTEYTKDSIVNSIINQHIERAKFGEKKYKTNLDRTDLKLGEWIEHAQQEAMDLTLYLEKIKQTLIDVTKLI